MNMRTLKYKILSILFAVIVLFSLNVVGQKNQIYFRADLDTTSILNHDSVKINVFIKNNSAKIVKIAEERIVGLNKDPYADFILYMEKRENNSFIFEDIPDDYNLALPEQTPLSLKRVR
jgi:hypothetical protein